MPLKAPEVDAILVALGVEPEFGVPDVVLFGEVLPEDVLPGEELVGEDVLLDEGNVDQLYVHGCSRRPCRLTCSCPASSKVQQ